MADWLSLGASLVGGLLGSKSSRSSTTQATASQDPWAPAQPYILQNLQNEAALQTQLQKTPFNQQQIEGYSNLFGDIGNFRDNVAPGLMDFANRGMTSSYQRQTGGAVGSGGGYGGAVKPGGLLSSGRAGPFSVATGAGARNTGANGLLDLNGAQNPYANGAIPLPASVPQQQQNQITALGGLLGGGSGGSGNGNAATGAPSGGIGVGSYTDSINEQALSIARQFGMEVGPIVGMLAGLASKGIDTSQALAAINASPDPIGALNALQGWTGVDPLHDLYGNTGGGGGGGGFGRSSVGGNDAHNGDSSHGTRGY